MSAGESDVSSAVMEDVGDALLRIFDLVERNFRLIRCGTVSYTHLTLPTKRIV